jgi:hypothetical protein
MLTKEEFNNINLWLGYLAYGITGFELSPESKKEVMRLACKCLDAVDELEKEESSSC